MRVLSLSSLRVLLSLVLAAHPAFAAGTRGGSPSKFAAAHEAALTDAAKAFVAADAVEADAILSPLAPLAETDADKAALEKFKAQLKEMAELRTPVAAAAAPQPADAESDILDSKYKGRVLALAVKVGADGEKAAEARRVLLRKTVPLGPDGKPLAGATGQPPTPAELAAIQRMEARKRLDKARTISAANRINASLGKLNGPEALPPGTDTANGALSSARQEAELLGVANSAFKGGPTTLKTNAVHAPGAEAPPAEKGWWTKFRDATTWDGAQKAFEGHNKEHMAAATAKEDKAAVQWAKGEYIDSIGNKSWAYAQKLWAGDAQTVKEVAITAGVVVAAAVAAPLLIPGAAAAAAVTAGTTTGVIVGGKLVAAGLYGLTAFNVVNGTGHLAHKPDLVNATLLAANAVAFPGIGKASEFVVGKAAHLTTRGGAAAAETTGAVALTTVAPELALAGGTAARTTASGVAATGTAVETAAAQVATVQVAARTAPTAEAVVVKAVEGVTENVLHVGAHKASAVKSDH